MNKTQKAKTFSIRLSDELLDWIKAQAEKEGRSVNNMIVRMLEEKKNSNV